MKLSKTPPCKHELGFGERENNLEWLELSEEQQAEFLLYQAEHKVIFKECDEGCIEYEEWFLKEKKDENVLQD